MILLAEHELLLACEKSDHGDASASVDIAEHYFGLGSRETAKKYYLLAAAQGSIVAASVIAGLHAEDGEYEDAVRWFETACLAGDKLACNHLSIACRGGLLGLIPDKEKADKYGRLGEVVAPE